MTKRALVFALIFFVLIALAGVFVFNPKLRENTATTPTNAAITPSGYLISMPSYGPLIRLQNIDVIFEGDKAIGTLPNAETAAVATPQKVVLYDKSGFTQPLGGQVTAVKAAENEGITKITIQLPEGTNTDLLLNEPDIITMETIASKRLPKSAIVTEADGETYVWIATPTAKDKTAFTIQKLYIKTGLDDLDYFEESGFKIKSSNLIVLNPDDAIDGGKTYRFKQVEMEAPIHNPIQQAWVDFEMNRLKLQQQEMQKTADNCGKANIVTGDSTTPAGETNAPASDSCGADLLEGATDPFAIFNALTNQQP